MIVISTLARYIKFGAVEVAPDKNEFDEKEEKELLNHKGFNNYVKSKLFSIEEDTEEDVGFDIEAIAEMTADEIKDAFNVKELKAICKQLDLSGVSKYNQDELVEVIQATI